MKKFASFLLASILLTQSLPAVARGHSVMEAKVSQYHAEAGDFRGCSLACGLPWQITSSDSLPSSKSCNYSPANTQDANFTTCWAEGAEGNGIGSYLEFRFEGHTPGDTCSFGGITLKNGYDKSRQLWEQNGRVKEFQMLINGQDMGTIALLDTPEAQSVSVRGITLKDGDVMQLVIKSVYPGTTYSDTCISEIQLGGGH